MADDLNDVIERAVLDLQNIIDGGSIPEDDEGLYEAFGGKKGAGKVSVPKKLTDKQIKAYFDFIGTPLTSKSEIDSVISAVRKNMKVNEPIKPANDPKSMAKLNPETATAREVAELYATERKLDIGAKAYGNMVAKYLGDVADQPGSAISIFTPDETGETPLSKIFKSLDLEVDDPKQSMQALRQVGLRIAKELPINSNLLPFLPDKSPDTPKNVKIFGIEEPPKRVSEVSIKTDAATMQNFFRQVAEIAKDPKQEAAAMAVIFNMQNGLRPNAAGQLKVSSYYPDTRAIYIPAETKGAKGRRVNVPLNDIADAILQARLQDGKTSDGYFFVKPNGKPVKSIDMTNVLKQVKIPKLIFDSGTNKTYDSLAPEGKAREVPGKRGSELLRNLHTKIAQRNGVSFERIAYLQGRSLKAAAEGSVGEQTTYAQDYPGDLDPKGPDARNANVVSTYFANAASEAGFDITKSVPPPLQRVGRGTPGYEAFFDAPVETAKMPAPAAPVEPDAPTSFSDFSEDELDKLGIKIDFSKLSSFATGVATTTGTAIAGTALYEAIRDPEGAGAAFARDTAMEAALLAAKAPAAVASAAVMAVDPSLGVGISPSTLRPEEDDMTYSGIIPLSDESMMEDIATRDSAMRLKPEAGKNFIPAPEVEDDNFLNMKP